MTGHPVIFPARRGIGDTVIVKIRGDIGATQPSVQG